MRPAFAGMAKPARSAMKPMRPRNLRSREATETLLLENCRQSHFVPRTLSCIPHKGVSGAICIPRTRLPAPSASSSRTRGRPISTRVNTAAGTTVELDLDVQRAIEEQRARRLSRLAVRDRLTLLVSVVLFLAVAGSLVVLLPSHRSPSIVTVALLIAAYAVAFRLDFEVGSNAAVPTQLILVPMLFVLPTGTVPLAVAGGILLSSALEYARGTLHAERGFLRLLYSWHAGGPALVLGIAGESPPNLRSWPIYLAALGAQFALDFASTAIRQWAALGVPPKIHLHSMVSVYVIDLGLAPG